MGVTDTLDATSAPRGAMTALTNLIPDPTSKNLWQCRPASMKFTNFSAFSPGDFVSCKLVVGSLVYGMIADSANPGFDKPFCFNLLSNSFITITGANAGNVPSSPPTIGAWTPPIMALVGQYVVIAHVGYNGVGSNFYGIIDLTAGSSLPVYYSTNMGTFPLASVPQWVAQFNGRAYFGLNPVVGQPSVAFSDPLNPLNATNGGQALTFGDNLPLTFGAGLPLNNQLGGIIQALIVFKGVTNMYQITGDALLGNLSVNALNISTGTISPLSVCATPQGLAFLAPDGYRFINFVAQVSDPLGNAGTGIVVPFADALYPSRVCAACNASVMRISTQNANLVGDTYQEYWYDLPRKCWSGPHTFPASLIGVWGDTFVMTPAGVLGTLFESDPVQSPSSTFVENGTQLQVVYQPAILPDVEQMAQCNVVETSINIGFPTGTSTVACTAADENGNTFTTAQIAVTNTAALWDSFNWGDGTLWGGAASNLRARTVPWPTAITFARLSLTFTCAAAIGVKFGDLYLRYQVLGYMEVGIAGT
jgi:hypothetical protein